jgi:glycosyltransferase involved in cell wall biosynthesis
LFNNELIRTKYDLRIVALDKPMLQSGGRFALTTLLTDISITFKILKTLISYKPQLTYVGLAQTPLGLFRDSLWIRLALLSGSKCLSHMHGGNFRKMFDDDISKPFQDVIKSKVLARLHGVIVLDPIFVSLFKELLPDERIFVLRNGIPDYFNQGQLDEAMRLRANREKIRATYLSNLVPGKGFDTFLEAAALLKEHGKENDFIFNLAGAAPNTEIETQVREVIRAHGLAESVHVLGKVVGKDKWRLLLDSDVFIFPTRYPPEGQPFAIIEALAAGLPIISTARGCIPAMVKEGVNGFIVAEDNASDVACRLMELQSNSALRQTMGKASRDLYTQNHSAESFVRGFVSILDKATGAY